MKKRIEYRKELGKMATYFGNVRLPIFNWFYYKEAFSRELVLNIIKSYNLKGLILDPFCGCGTTLLACSEIGIDSIGFDILPIAILSSKAKILDYDMDRLKETAKIILKKPFKSCEVSFPKYIERYFSRNNLKDMAFFLKIIKDIDNDMRFFFRLAFINSAIQTSYSHKDGGILKFKKRKTAPFRYVFKYNILKMIKDLKVFRHKKGKASVCFGDARTLPLDTSIISAVITSPPYLGQTDYQRVYRLENFFACSLNISERFIGKEKKGVLPSFFSQHLPEKTKPYFFDMYKVLKEMYRVCEKDGKVCMIVANAFIDDALIECDLLLSKMAEHLGFILKKIIVLNERYALKERTKKVGILRESLIILEK